MTRTIPPIRENLLAIKERISSAATAAGRDSADVKLIAVSKYMPVDWIAAAIEAGQFVFGENTVQDALDKLPLMQDKRTEWHFIGHLQGNKAKYIPGHFSWLHTLDELKLAQRLSRLAESSGAVVNTLIQVNISADPDKFGLPKDAVFDFVESLLTADLQGLRLRGLMNIGSRTASEVERRREFSGLRELGGACASRFGDGCFGELSMGMSDDFELAIAEGATMVRVGSSIFGPRPAARA